MLNSLIRTLCLVLLSFCSALLPSTTSFAQEQKLATAKYQEKAADLLQILKGSEKEEDFFAKSFLDAVPVPQFRTLLDQLKVRYGVPQSIANIIPASALDGTVEVNFAKAVVAMRMVIDKDAPHPVIGLLITGANVRGDGIDQIAEEISALPGRAGFEVAELSGERPQPTYGTSQKHSFAIGSTFKVYVLAELTRSISAGERQWNDVLRLDGKSLPSGVLQTWPKNAPLTLQTLTTMMISISDNTATDILMREIGKARLANIVKRTGHAEPQAMLPMLTTLEAFALKMPGNARLRKRYMEASDSEQMKLLEANKSKLGLESVSITNLANKPQFIDQIEWFASPADISNLLHYVHRLDDPVAREILSINRIIPPGDAARWNYVGGKGGSEPGVVSYAFLVTAKSGKIYAVSASWNDPKAPVDGAIFLGFMNRLLNLVAQR